MSGHSGPQAKHSSSLFHVAVVRGMEGGVKTFLQSRRKKMEVFLTWPMEMSAPGVSTFKFEHSTKHTHTPRSLTVVTFIHRHEQRFCFFVRSGHKHTQEEIESVSTILPLLTFVNCGVLQFGRERSSQAARNSLTFDAAGERRGAAVAVRRPLPLAPPTFHPACCKSVTRHRREKSAALHRRHAHTSGGGFHTFKKMCMFDTWNGAVFGGGRKRLLPILAFYKRRHGRANRPSSSTASIVLRADGRTHTHTNGRRTHAPPHLLAGVELVREGEGGRDVGDGVRREGRAVKKPREGKGREGAPLSLSLSPSFFAENQAAVEGGRAPASEGGEEGGGGTRLYKPTPKRRRRRRCRRTADGVEKENAYSSTLPCAAAACLLFPAALQYLT